MQFVLTPYSYDTPSFAWWHDAFNEEELNILQNLAKKSVDDGIIEDHSNKANTRRSKNSWLFNTIENLWVYERLSHVISSLNSRYYGFDLTGFGEPLQLSNYEENGIYGWHVDCGINSTVAKTSRKLSLIMQLTDSNEYDGGDLQIMYNDIINIKKQKGLITVFPSYTPHQLTPITRGNRQSLVAWISGPPFK